MAMACGSLQSGSGVDDLFGRKNSKHSVALLANRAVKSHYSIPYYLFLENLSRCSVDEQTRTPACLRSQRCCSQTALKISILASFAVKELLHYISLKSLRRTESSFPFSYRLSNFRKCMFRCHVECMGIIEYENIRQNGLAWR